MEIKIYDMEKTETTIETNGWNSFLRYSGFHSLMPDYEESYPLFSYNNEEGTVEKHFESDYEAVTLVYDADPSDLAAETFQQINYMLQNWNQNDMSWTNFLE